MEALRDMAPGFEEEFGTLARLVPMWSRPNRRAEPDPNRQAFEIVGVFHEAMKIMGPGRQLKDGLSETDIASQKCTFSAERGAFLWPATQGDVLEIPELCRTFTILTPEFEMAFRTRLILEESTSPAR
jgi:hypothetical protein